VNCFTPVKKSSAHDDAQGAPDLNGTGLVFSLSNSVSRREHAQKKIERMFRFRRNGTGSCVVHRGQVEATMM
jgi:hypothetical protein